METGDQNVTYKGMWEQQVDVHVDTQFITSSLAQVRPKQCLHSFSCYVLLGRLSGLGRNKSFP